MEKNRLFLYFDQLREPAILFRVEDILKGSLNLIPSTSPSVEIQIMGGSCKGKTLLGVVNKLLKT